MDEQRQEARVFPDEASARKWFEKQVWPDGEKCCVRCGSSDTYRAKHRTMPYRCRSCGCHFSVKTGTAEGCRRHTDQS